MSSRRTLLEYLFISQSEKRKDQRSLKDWKDWKAVRPEAEEPPVLEEWLLLRGFRPAFGAMNRFTFDSEPEKSGQRAAMLDFL